MLKKTGSLDLTLKDLVANNNKFVEGGDKADDKNLSVSKNLKNTKSKI